MLFLIAFVGAAIIALVLWKAMNASRNATPPAVRRPQSPVRSRPGMRRGTGDYRLRTLPELAPWTR